MLGICLIKFSLINYAKFCYLFLNSAALVILHIGNTLQTSASPSQTQWRYTSHPLLVKLVWQLGDFAFEMNFMIHEITKKHMTDLFIDY